MKTLEFVLVKYDVIIGDQRIQGSPVAIKLWDRSVGDAVDAHFKNYWKSGTLTIKKAEKYQDSTSRQTIEITGLQELYEKQFDTFVSFGLHSEN